MDFDENNGIEKIGFCRIPWIIGGNKYKGLCTENSKESRKLWQVRVK